MHAMWKPQKFKYIYLLATLYVFTLTIPSASAVYWAFGDQLLNHSNAFSLLPHSAWRDAAVILMLIHQVCGYLGFLLVLSCLISEIDLMNQLSQFITFGFACTPLYFVWEKVVGMHDTKSICLRAVSRLPVVIPIWFLAIIFPFFGPINSAVGSLLVSFTVYIIPALAHMLTYKSASARKVGFMSQVPTVLGFSSPLMDITVKKDEVVGISLSFSKFSECSRETSLLPPKLDSNLCGERGYRDMGVRSRIRIRRLG
ncbi:Auxin transporter-like protein 2 [Gossypium australe]|uniref:Auxin transporter-like protein 2 n=1 Tax=Gossypium australe TaxID=47621 RepID=A0A5B6WJJ0_9ROSI|nr:Auxin transporter-like protein 2 [Gossypium australe]